ncbi:PIG-L deacetylase family protein [Sinorhizobium fredii]|uniref:PIG-L deacetylase family protein n=1 Tax=Rhizobium fredii TaxID=380 RepID=UPI0004BA7D60|nr:PIG-L deacetylase family protein [Sinorhizobium fredii]
MFESYSGPIVIVAPHPDDETLGAGGFLLRAIEAGTPVHWLIVTGITTEQGWAQEKVARREREIAAVAEAYGFAGVHRLDLPSAKLETIPLGELVSAFGAIVKSVEPKILLVPHRGDAHSDHHIVYEAATACTKWFRYPSVDWTMAYETLSETDAGLFNSDPFLPNLFIDISSQLEKKLHITSMFGDEIGDFPFPRSLEAVSALARVRGAASGYTAAEAFMLLRGRT